MGGAKKGAAVGPRQLYRRMVEQKILLIRNLHKVREVLLELQVRGEGQRQRHELDRVQRYEQFYGVCLSRCLKVIG